MFASNTETGYTELNVDVYITELMALILNSINLLMKWLHLCNLLKTNYGFRDFEVYKIANKYAILHAWYMAENVTDFVHI